MPTFSGFPEGKIPITGVPDLFFQELLPEIDNLAELKVTLYAFWRLNKMEGVFRYLTIDHFISDQTFLRGLGTASEQAEVTLEDALQRCVNRGTFLCAEVDKGSAKLKLFFVNSPKGRAAVQAINRGEWRPSEEPITPVEIYSAPPNIYRLYEEHIGPLTPMIAESLREAENTYPPGWIEDAFRIAVDNNVRRWSYIEAILKRWQEGGRDEQKDRRDSEKDRRRYVEGEFSDLIEH